MLSCGYALLWQYSMQPTHCAYYFVAENLFTIGLLSFQSITPHYTYYFFTWVIISFVSHRQYTDANIGY